MLKRKIIDGATSVDKRSEVCTADINEIMLSDYCFLLHF